jgi:hypothetical protein
VQSSGNDDTGPAASGRTRALSPAERAIVGAILGDRAAPRTTVVPRSTRQVATARVYLREWIRDRYVPRPITCGWPRITFVVAQPFAEKLTGLSRDWREMPGAVVLWGSHRILFGVFFRHNDADEARLRQTVSALDLGPAPFVLSQDLGTSAVPVYFDFEASWARVCGSEGTGAYPQSLPRHASSEGSAAPSLPSKSERIAITRMVTRPFLGSPRLSDHRAGLGSIFSGAENRCLRNGLVEFRSFLNLMALAKDVTEFPKQLVFVHGTLSTSARPEGLFRELVQAGGTSPFLFTTDGQRVLLGALSAGHRSSPGAHVASGETVLAILKKHLGSIVLVEEELANMTALVDHRYDRLVEP